MSDIIFQSNEIEIECLIKSDCHLHTSWTDGKGSVQEVYEKAIQSGLKSILFSEHSRKTSTDWFYKFVNEVRQLPTKPCKAYVGTEVKIETNDGDIDTTPEISSQCDFVMASVHRFIDESDKTIQFNETDPNQAIEIEYRLTRAVLSNPKIDILGHMFGMSYRRFNKIPPENLIKKLIARAAEFGVAVEINSYYHPNVLKMFNWCKKIGVKVAFGSNAHSLEEVGSVMRKLEKELNDA